MDAIKKVCPKRGLSHTGKLGEESGDSHAQNSPGKNRIKIGTGSGLIFVDKPVVVTNASVTGVNFTANR